MRSSGDIEVVKLEHENGYTFKEGTRTMINSIEYSANTFGIHLPQLSSF